MKKILFAALVARRPRRLPDRRRPTAPVEDKSGARAAPGADFAGATTSGTTTSGVSGPSTSGANPLKDPNNILSKRSVYFEFDSFTVADQYKPIVEAHAKYLAANRNAEGHAAGPRRRARLARVQHRARPEARRRGQADDDAAGRAGTIVETVSFGKEKPRNMGHDEAAWAENRRVDIIYAGE